MHTAIKIDEDAARAILATERTPLREGVSISDAVHQFHCMREDYLWERTRQSIPSISDLHADLIPVKGALEQLLDRLGKENARARWARSAIGAAIDRRSHTEGSGLHSVEELLQLARHVVVSIEELDRLKETYDDIPDAEREVWPVHPGHLRILHQVLRPRTKTRPEVRTMLFLFRDLYEWLFGERLPWTSCRAADFAHALLGELQIWDTSRSPAQPFTREKIARLLNNHFRPSKKESKATTPS
jgi:hypothetical protein